MDVVLVSLHYVYAEIGTLLYGWEYLFDYVLNFAHEQLFPLVFC